MVNLDLPEVDRFVLVGSYPKRQLFATSLDFGPSGSRRKVAPLPSPAVPPSPYRGFCASQANTSPTGQERSTR